MKGNLLGYAIAGALAGTLSTNTVAGTVSSDGADIVIKTKGGFEAKTTDDQFSFKIGGRIQIQADTFEDTMNLIEHDGDRGDNLYFRRARIYLKGTMYEHWGYKIQFNLVDSGSGGGTVEDLYIRWQRYNMAKITVGKHYEPLSLQELTSSKWVTAVERAAINDFFAEGRNVGISLQGANKLWGYGVGIYDNGGQFSDSGEQKWAYTGRFFGSPINSERALLHVGLGYTARDARDVEDAFDGTTVTQGIKRGDEVQVSVDEIRSQTIAVAEIAGKIGLFHGAAEYHRRDTDAEGNGKDASTNGYYVQGGWFITGESRPYKKGTWQKVKPNNKRLGAWEVYLRYEGLNFDDDGINPENRNKANITTVGANWYPNEILRISANYVYTQWNEALVSDGEDLVRADSLNDPDLTALDSGQGFSVRFQAAF